VFNRAVEALEAMYFIGIQSVYDLSVAVMLRKMNMSIPAALEKERDQSSSRRIEEEKRAILTDTRLMARAREVNQFDIRLYERGTANGKETVTS